MAEASTGGVAASKPILLELIALQIWILRIDCSLIVI